MNIKVDRACVVNLTFEEMTDRIFHFLPKEVRKGIVQQASSNGLGFILQGDLTDEVLEMVRSGLEGKPSKTQLLAQRIEDLDLSTRAKKALSKGKITTLKQLTDLTEAAFKQLQGLRGFRNKTRQEIEFFLEDKGLKIRQH